MRMALFNFVLADMADKVLKKLRREDLSHHCTRHLAYCDSFSVGLKCSLTLHNNGHSQAAPGKRRKFEKIGRHIMNRRCTTIGELTDRGFIANGIVEDY